MATKKAKGPEEKVLYIVRTLRVPRETLFKFLTDARELKKWFNPTSEYTVESVETNPKTGGAWRIGMKPPDGPAYYASGVYREIKVPYWVVFTFNWEGERTWAPDPVKNPAPESVVIFQLKAKDDGKSTEFFFWHNGLLDEKTMDEHKWGWSGILDSLDRYVVL